MKNSIRDARTPQPGKIVFNTMRYRSSETVHRLGYFQSSVQIMFKVEKITSKRKKLYVKTCMAHFMQYPLLQWEVAKVKQLTTSNMTLTVFNLHQKTPKGATTKIQVKRHKR